MACHRLAQYDLESSNISHLVHSSRKYGNEDIWVVQTLYLTIYQGHTHKIYYPLLLDVSPDAKSVLHAYLCQTFGKHTRNGSEYYLHHHIFPEYQQFYHFQYE